MKLLLIKNLNLLYDIIIDYCWQDINANEFAYDSL